MPILVRSFDYDGCLAGLSGIGLKHVGIIDLNKVFLDEIKTRESVGVRKTYTMNGSSRQSWEIDFLNKIRNKNGSCFGAILAVSEYLNAEFLSFLMADVDGGVEIGTSFNAAQAEILGKLSDCEHSAYWYDESKVRLLYAQMHYVASLHPNEDIIFDFYDDKKDILTDLSDFFSKNDGPLLIPSNIRLSLNRYDGVTLSDSNSSMYEQIGTIQGTGVFDVQYGETSQDMVFLAADKQKIDKENLMKGTRTVDIAKNVSPHDVLEAKNNKRSDDDLEPHILETDSSNTTNDSSNNNLSSKPVKQVMRDDFQNILDAYQTTNWLYKYFFCCFGLKRSATMTALYDLLENNPTQAGFTIQEVGNKIHTCTDRHRQHRFFLFNGLPKEESNGTGTDKVVENLRNAFCT